MKYSYRLSVLFLLFSTSLFSQSFDGFTLYNEQNRNTTYLIDKDGNTSFTWDCNTSGNYAVHLTEEGNLIRGGVYSGNRLTGAAIGGIIQEYDSNSDVVWEYVYSTSDHCSHHDFTVLPNGNVILIAWEVKSVAELTQAGVSNASTDQWPTHFIELEPDGNGSATIVWEWHMWDHLIQDVDNTKDNYGVIADHPELMDINAITVSSRPGPGGGGGDWFHVNGIDYNEKLDQLVFTSRYASEVFIIDHSTTTAEAASHSGGNSGMGGDFLYRWGNPSNYDHSGTQEVPAAVHDPRWIKDGRPYAGYIQFFNNEGGSGGSSAVDAIKTPVDGYTYTYVKGEAYGPSGVSKRHDCIDNADGQSASDRMSNGNIFVALSREYMYEVDSNDKIVWQYSASPAKAFRFECDYDGIIALLGESPCGTVSISDPSSETVELYPNPSTGFVQIGLTNTDELLQAEVYDLLGNRVFIQNSAQAMNLTELAKGVYTVKLTFNDHTSLSQQIVLCQ